MCEECSKSTEQEQAFFRWGFILLGALEEIAKGHDGHQTFSGTQCQEIAKKAHSKFMAKVKG